MGWIAGNGLSGAVQLLGERQDVSVLNNLFDVACLSSHMEAFPNVIGEAMACGTPCVATDVGDCRSIIGATGRVVQPENSEALAEALVEMLKLPADERKVMGVVACEKMNAEFDIVSVVKKYMAHYECIVLAAAI
jgi:glycosyltransferase involved in cell wall biosynthesis